MTYARVFHLENSYVHFIITKSQIDNKTLDLSGKFPKMFVGVFLG